MGCTSKYGRRLDPGWPDQTVWEKLCVKSRNHTWFSVQRKLTGYSWLMVFTCFSPWTSRGVLQFLKQFQGSLLEGTTTPKNQAFFNRRSPSWEGDSWTKKHPKKQQLGWALGAEALVALHDLGPPGALLLASRGFPPVAIRGSESWEHQLWRFSSVGWRRIYGNGPMINLSRVCGKSEVDQKNNSYIYIYT